MGQKDGNSLISYIISGLNLVSNWLHSGLDASTISLRFSDSILFKPSSQPHHTPSYCKPLFIPSSSSSHFPKTSFLCILWTNPYSPVEPCFKCPILCKAFLILVIFQPTTLCNTCVGTSSPCSVVFQHTFLSYQTVAPLHIWYLLRT